METSLNASHSTQDYEPISPIGTPAARCSSINPAAARREAEMIGITGGFSVGPGELVDRIRHWLKCLCQWEKDIDVCEVKLPINRTQQATLDATLDAIRPFLKRELSRDQQKMLLAEAAARNKGHPTPSQDCLLGMITPEGVEKGLRAWPNSFLGQLHCETVLALMLGNLLCNEGQDGCDKALLRLLCRFPQSPWFQEGRADAARAGLSMEPTHRSPSAC